MELQFRPHHFLCALCFQGRGYSPAFVTNFHVIMAALQEINGDNIDITITNKTDSICAPCPHRIEQNCSTEEKIAVLDRAHSNALQLQHIKSITWGDAKKRIAENISLALFHDICSTCNWKSLGICENVLTGFLQNHEKQNE